MRALTADEVFWSRVDVRGGFDCWRFHDADRYGSFNGTQAHRYSWSFAYGDIPTGAMVLHACDNAWCVNPRHLRLGTFEDNTKDKMVLGRVLEVRASAEAAKIELPEVEPQPTPSAFAAAIRRIRAASGLTVREFGKKVGVTGPAVCGWESGTHGAPLSRMATIAKVFGCDIRDLLGDATS